MHSVVMKDMKMVHNPHEGWGELTSADVKFSLDMTMSDESIMGNKNKFIDPDNGVESIETPDPYTVILHFRGLN